MQEWGHEAGTAMTNWGQIALLEGRCAWHLGRYHYRRKQWEKWKATGDTAHYWLKRHQDRHEAAAAAANERQIENCRTEILKWSKLMEPELAEVVRYRTAIAKLRPKQQEWPMGGWVRPGTPNRMQRQDQGQDFEIPLYHSVVAPGPGHCISYGADRPFPNGFGDPYAVVHIDAGPFGGNDWYLGHANEPIIRPGESFSTGQPLARLNHSLNEGWGWIELGHVPIGGMSEGERWHYLFKPVWR